MASISRSIRVIAASLLSRAKTLAAPPKFDSCSTVCKALLLLFQAAEVLVRNQLALASHSSLISPRRRRLGVIARRLKSSHSLGVFMAIAKRRSSECAPVDAPMHSSFITSPSSTVSQRCWKIAAHEFIICSPFERTARPVAILMLISIGRKSLR